MKYLIILFTLITISSCCKKVDGVCCDDGVYVRFENQTDQIVNLITIDSTGIAGDGNRLLPNNASTMIDFLKYVNNPEDKVYGISITHSDSLFSYTQVEFDFGGSGCYKIELLDFHPERVFGDGIDLDINKI